MLLLSNGRKGHWGTHDGISSCTAIRYIPSSYLDSGREDGGIGMVSDRSFTVLPRTGLSQDYPNVGATLATESPSKNPSL